MRWKPRGSPRIPGRQWRARQHAVEIAQDHLGLVEREAVVFEHRHPAERMTGQVLRRGSDRDRHGQETIPGTLLLKGGEYRAPERAAGDAVNSEVSHDLSSFRHVRRHDGRSRRGKWANRR
jgi:hypothetical protein